jgi:hypothetical protein
MAKRPTLTEDTFLKHLFSPKRNALPTGIRKSALKPARGRTNARVASHNRMSGASQEILRRSGLRDAYLKGQASLADAKRALRQVAVEKGLARPLRTRAGKPTHKWTPTSLDATIAVHVVKALRDSGRPVNIDRVHDHVKYLDDDIKVQVVRWPVARIRAYASDSDNIIEIPGEKPFNPLWYN